MPNKRDCATVSAFFYPSFCGCYIRLEVLVGWLAAALGTCLMRFSKRPDIGRADRSSALST